MPARSGDGRYSGANQATVRRNNRAAIYKAIWDLGRVPRAELAVRTGLHAATITHIVEDLQAEGLVRETGTAETSVGRPPVYLEIQPGAAYVVGVNLARNGVRGVLADLRGRPVEQVAVSGVPNSAGEHELTRFFNAVQVLLEAARVSGRPVIGIGVGTPGPVRTATGEVYHSPNWAIWPRETPLPLGQMLRERFGLPVYIDNNANAAALAERYFGAGPHLDNFLYISCNFGVGGGVIMNGELHRGSYGAAGEVGHTTVNSAGPRCSCGNTGCLELYAAVPAITARAAAALGADPAAVGVREVAAAYAAGHDGVTEVLAAVAGYLATAATTAVNLLAPEAVIIGGQLGELALHLAPLVQEQVQQRVFSVLSQQIRVLPSAVTDGPVLGAATLVLRQVINSGFTALE